MAVTIVKRPEGHKIIDQAIAADISDSGGDALITFPYHSLSDGDYVYIVSDIDEYNGFWYVTTITANTFKISEYEDADFVEYFQDLEIDYYKTQVHDWNSIFLPIVYKISNNRWPINGVDLVRTISSFSDDNGYTTITPSGPLKLSIQALEYVKISGSSDDDLNGVWQLVETVGGIVIDLPYDSTNALVGASIQYYYNNYQVKVRIYAGLPVTHPWQPKKPYEEVAELSLTPDENGIVMFSVAEYIRGKTKIENNTTLYTQPLNLDAFTAFYIAITETFDDSDGYTLGTNTVQPFVDDTFVGYAITGKLPFKNTYSGDYADYVYTSGSPALWLTNMETLLAVDGLYFDISFIKNVTGPFVLRINKYVSDYLTTIEDIAYVDQGIGVYRVPIEVDSAYDRYCVQVLFDDGSTPGDPGWSPPAFPPIAGFSWVATLNGTWNPGDSWGLTGSGIEFNYSTGIVAGGKSDQIGPIGYPLEAGRSYQFSYSIFIDQVGATADTVKTTFLVMDVVGTILLSYDTATSFMFGGVTRADVVNFVAPPTATKIAIIIEWPVGTTAAGDGFFNYWLDETASIPATPGTPLYVSGTEEICIDIIGTCDAQGGFTPTDRRLLEDGGYRLLE